MSKSIESTQPGDLAVPKVAVFNVADLTAADYNPRTISEPALAGLSRSIERFGCVEPIVVNVRGHTRRIVGGHQRLKALQQLGVEKVLCVTVRCTAAEEKLLNVTLNNPEIQGRFTAELDEYIAALRDELADPALLRDLRLDALYAGIEKPSEKQGKVPDDDLPPKPKKAVTQPADLWLLGEHRLLCGDSTRAEDVARVMDGRKARLFATDPPYCINYTGKDRPGGGHDWTGVYQESTELGELYEAFYRLGLEHVESAAPLYLWHADRRRVEIERVCEKLQIHIHQEIIWVKPCCVLGFSYYALRHEPCLLMWPRRHKPPIDKDARRITNKVTAVWPIGYQKTGDPTTPEYYSDVWELDWDGKKRPVGIAHPTVKPVECFAIPMRIHTQPRDVCYEPFSGSGTQIVAAEKLGRRCFAIEKQPLFVDVAVKRWEQWTGKKAVLEKRHRGR
jgi:DNA modification methylase/uncharacterized ParB-like nuclease family protein